MGFSPQYPDFTDSPRQPEEPNKAVPATSDSPELQPEADMAQADQIIDSPNVVQGLGVDANGPSLIGDSLDLTVSEGQPYHLPELESIAAEPVIPTDRLILEDEAEDYGEQTSAEDFGNSEYQAAEIPAPVVPVRLTRIESLTMAIDKYPQSPANFVLRGEAYLDEGKNTLAEQDFLTALELSEQGAETADWGYIHRAFYDRAKEGLRHCR